MKANHIMAEWDKKSRELGKNKLLRKRQVRDQGEEIGSDDDDDDDNDDEVPLTWIGMSWRTRIC